MDPKCWKMCFGLWTCRNVSFLVVIYLSFCDIFWSTEDWEFSTPEESLSLQQPYWALGQNICDRGPRICRTVEEHGWVGSMQLKVCNSVSLHCLRLYLTLMERLWRPFKASSNDRTKVILQQMLSTSFFISPVRLKHLPIWDVYESRLRGIHCIRDKLRFRRSRRWM